MAMLFAELAEMAQFSGADGSRFAIWIISADCPRGGDGTAGSIAC